MKEVAGTCTVCERDHRAGAFRKSYGSKQNDVRSNGGVYMRRLFRILRWIVVLTGMQLVLLFLNQSYSVNRVISLVTRLEGLSTIASTGFRARLRTRLLPGRPSSDFYGSVERVLAPDIDRILFNPGWSCPEGILVPLVTSDVGDADIRTLATAVSRLWKCPKLSLSGTAVSDSGLASIASIQKLEFLDLSASRVTDHGISRLAQHPRLRELNLSYTGVSDAALNYLCSIPSLDHLDLTGTEVTDGGCDQLRQSMPDVNIVRRAMPTEPLDFS